MHALHHSCVWLNIDVCGTVLGLHLLVVVDNYSGCQKWVWHGWAW